jgi:hypothetical protein
MRAARHGVCGPASLEAAHGDHLVPRPDSDGEGAGAAVQDHVGVIVELLKGWNQAAPMDQDEGGGEQLGWQLDGQVGAKIVSVHHFAKFHLARQFVYRNLPQQGKDQCLPWALSPRSTKGNSSDHVAAAARARSASLGGGGVF